MKQSKDEWIVTNLVVGPEPGAAIRVHMEEPEFARIVIQTPETKSSGDLCNICDG